MIALFFGILGASIGIFRREVAEVFSMVAIEVMRRNRCSLDRFLSARSRSNYRASLR